ncbi:hypothetical protein AB0M97_12605 [Streptomyces sp. NPDC051207]|uniref:hypothetical protein n=1 Tax=Streptomyces sp. NPDC051207 TaxID=3154641 RepID=UPI0034321666
MAQTRRRLRSSTVVLGGMGVVAAALTSCGSDPDRRCVDRDDYDPYGGYEIIDDKYCESGESGGSSYGSGTNASWYYGGRTRNGRTGDDGSFSRSEAVDRGGFGCSAGSGGG